ncbi:FHA domain-containing protein DDL [Drosophila busckii]|uniref:FHA domain-containing protein DDL n=1 Tax=Drosophila busckii TaxID=30019 RepID=UPI00083EE859|nr:FHA domain-containing protein DDL [Drosophila busckii]
MVKLTKSSRESEHEAQNRSSDEDTKPNNVKSKSGKHADAAQRERGTRQAKTKRSTSRSSSSSESSSSSSSNETRDNKRTSKSKAIQETVSPKREKQQQREYATPESKVQEQRSKWDSPERNSAEQRHNSSRNINKVRKRSHSRSRSRERERERERERDRDRDREREKERERERDRDRDRDNQMRRGRDRERSKERRSQRSRSNERRQRSRRSPEARRSPESRRRSRSRSPHDRSYRGGGGGGTSRRPQQRRNDNRQKDDESFEWGKPNDDKNKPSAEDEPVEKEKPNFGLSGALTEDTNKVNGVVVKYSEPPEARKPKRRWRLYPFKGETALPTLHIHRQSCFLVGRDRKVVDLAVDHPSCSKQHAALQYRLVPFEREDGSQGKRVRLYLIDLESANGTFLNNKKVDGRKYYELMEKDVIKFGFSSREYVLLHENSKEDQEDDDVFIKEEPLDIKQEPQDNA